MKIIPITLKDANRFIIEYHRHHSTVVGAKFAIGLFKEELLGVAICGRPVSRHLDNGFIIEVTRLCVKDDVKNGCSMLYAACAKTAKCMGYEKIITYILESESGTSLKASGWELELDKAGGKLWNNSKDRIRVAERTDLFGVTTKYPSELKKRYSRCLN
jgi:hypothetical protein